MRSAWNPAAIAGSEKKIERGEEKFLTVRRTVRHTLLTMTNRGGDEMATTSSGRRHVYRIEDPGGPQHGERISFGPSTPPMFARERFQLADGRLVWIEYVGAVQS